MNFYQMNSEKVAEFLGTNIDAGKISEDIANKNVDKGWFESFLYIFKDELRSLFSWLDLLPAICYFIALFFSILNRQYDLLSLSITSILITALLYFLIVALLCVYRRRFQMRLDQNAQMVSVIRNGEETAIPASELEIGDLVLLEKGTLLYGDARIIEEEELYANEQLVFSLTIASQKTAAVLDGENLPPEEQCNMLWKGSYISKGHGLAIITALGADCYIEKTGGRKSVRQRSWFYNKQKNIGHLGSYVYVLFMAIAVLLALIVTARFTDAILMMGVLGSVVMLNPFLLLTEWNYYRTAEDLFQKGAHIRNIEAFDGMNKEKSLYYSSDELLEDHLSFASIEPLEADEYDCLSYFSLCLGNHPLSRVIEQDLVNYKIDRKKLERDFPNFRSEQDDKGNVFSLFAGDERSVAVAAGYWQTMLPFISSVDDHLLTRLNQLEQGGRLVWLLCSKEVFSIPNQLSTDEFDEKMTPMGLITFAVSENKSIAEKIKELQHSKMKVFLVNRYHAQFGNALANTYNMDGVLSSPPEDPCYTLPHLKENPYVVFDDASPIKKEKAKIVLSGGISSQDIIYRVKCMFCGIKRSIGFFSCFSALLIVSSFIFFLRGFSLERLIVPALLLKPALVCVCYYLVETVGNCNQYKRSLLLGALCGIVGCVAALFKVDSALLSMLLATVLLSIVFLFNVRKIRPLQKKDAFIIAIALITVLLPWIFLGGNWWVAVIFSFVPPIVSFIINLFY